MDSAARRSKANPALLTLANRDLVDELEADLWSLKTKASLAAVVGVDVEETRRRDELLEAARVEVKSVLEELAVCLGGHDDVGCECVRAGFLRRSTSLIYLSLGFNKLFAAQGVSTAGAE